MQILFIAAEGAPFAKVGGLADVVGSLPAALKRSGHDVRVIMPHHGTIDDDKFGIRPYRDFDLSWNDAVTQVEIARTVHKDVPVYFLRGWPFFAAGESFVYSSDEGIDVGRFLFFSVAALEWVRRLAEHEDWSPDVIHIHDWHTAMVPFLLRRVYHGDPVLGKVGTLFSIHNMRYQGWGVGWHLHRAGLPGVDHPLLRAMDRADNTLAVGLAYSTMLSTVSPRYAQEIISPEGGFGLDGLLHARLSRLKGILNGIDVDRWDPAASTEIAVPFSGESLRTRAKNKAALQKELGLPILRDTALMGIVTRLVDQKGLPILVPAVRHMLQYAEMQFVLLGTGNPYYEDQLRRVGHDFPEKSSIQLTFSEALSERIYAGVDMFLMPSQFEPCGIGQMIAMRYGALPVVRAIGGLADTVSADVGFVFNDFHPGALQWAMGNALDIYYNNAEEWRERQQRAMSRDFSWELSARRYSDLYQAAITTHQHYQA